jgi:hypothetical protein
MTVIRLFLLPLAAALIAIGAAPTVAQTCAGDCDGNGAVAVEEIILGVRIALGEAAAADCLAMDADGSGTVAIDELLAAVRHALDGCAPSPTTTATGAATPTPTNTVAPTTGTADLAAAVRVATDPIFRVFDLQESVLTAVITAARARRTARGGSGEASGCQQLDCELSGTQEVCCSAGQYTQTFDNCSFDDAGGTGTLNGQFAITSSSSTLCSGGIPLDASFVLTLDSFTHDVALGGSDFFRSFHQFSESYDKEVVDCTVSNPDVFGFGIRGSGSRVLNGVLRRFQLDGPDDLAQDFESGVDALEIGIGSNEQSDTCFADAVLNGTVRSADFRDGTRSTTFTNFHVLENPQDDGTMLLQLNGRAATDCLGAVQLSTTDQLRSRLASALLRRASRVADRRGHRVRSLRAAAARRSRLRRDGTADQHFAACTDVPIDQCTTNAVGLCGACTAVNDCQRGLSCFPCSGECSGTTKRCAFADAFVTCADGTF